MYLRVEKNMNKKLALAIPLILAIIGTRKFVDIMGEV